MKSNLGLMLGKRKLSKEDIDEIFGIIGELNRQEFNFAYMGLSEKKRISLMQLFKDKKIRDCLEIIEFLNKNDINYVVMKGITLWYFDRDRSFGDLDLLVDKKDFERTVKLLDDKFICNYFNNPERIKGFKHLIKSKFVFFHHLGLSPLKKLKIEVHCFLASYSFIDSEKINFKTNKKYLKINGVGVPCLKPEVKIIENILHGIYTHALMINHEKWLKDINTVIRNNKIDWNKFVMLNKKFKVSEATYRSIRFFNRILKGDKLQIPGWVVKRIFDNSSKMRLFLTDYYDNRIFPKHYTFEYFYKMHRLNRILSTVGFNKNFFISLFSFAKYRNTMSI